MINIRALAVRTLQSVIQSQQSLTAVLPAALDQCDEIKDRALVQEICYGVLRWYFQLKPMVEKLLFSPLKPNDQDILLLLFVGIYQLLKLDVPDYAAVSETVAAARVLKKPWACGLLNKTLRLFSDEKNHFIALANQTLVGKYAHPAWFIQAIQAAWPDQWQNILSANNEYPPMFLRVNSQKISRDDYLSLLHDQQIDAAAYHDLPQAIRLSQPIPVTKLPGFNDGLCYVQDAAGQYAALLLDLKKQMSILDACAAPGSKTTHILELQPQIKKLVAIDNEAKRLALIKKNILRLTLPMNKIHLVLADAGQTNTWTSDEMFDRILLDAPCSATGIIRRHPDIKVLRHKTDIEKYHQKQFYLMNALWPLLKNNGILLYSTCSVLPAENENVIELFLIQHKDAQILPLNIPHAIHCTYGQQLLPTKNGVDGFYYAKLLKSAPIL